MDTGHGQVQGAGKQQGRGKEEEENRANEEKIKRTKICMEENNKLDV